MSTQRKIIVDADAFVALHDELDPNHSNAVSFIDEIEELELDLLVSDPAFGEAVTVISQDTDHKTAVGFALEILQGPSEIVEVDSSLRTEALNIFSKQTSKNSRFTDCINMAIMRREGIDTIFSFDKHYKKNGFKRFGIDEPKKA